MYGAYILPLCSPQLNLLPPSPMPSPCSPSPSLPPSLPPAPTLPLHGPRPPSLSCALSCAFPLSLYTTPSPLPLAHAPLHCAHVPSSCLHMPSLSFTHVNTLTPSPAHAPLSLSIPLACTSSPPTHALPPLPLHHLRWSKSVATTRMRSFEVPRWSWISVTASVHDLGPSDFSLNLMKACAK